MEQDNKDFLNNDFREYEAMLDECTDIAEDVLQVVAKRVIRSLNKQEKEGKLNVFQGTYPSNFTFFDKLAYEMESKTYIEIDPLLEGIIEQTMWDEYNKLSRKDKFFIDYCLSYPDTDDIIIKIDRVFQELRLNQVSLKKIDNFIMNY